jgi:hypothetical protein
VAGLGASLDVYRSLSKRELVDVFEEFGPTVVWHFSVANRFYVIEENSEIFVAAVEMILRSFGRGWILSRAIKGLGH